MMGFFIEKTTLKTIYRIHVFCLLSHLPITYYFPLDRFPHSRPSWLRKKIMPAGSRVEEIIMEEIMVIVRWRMDKGRVRVILGSVFFTIEMSFESFITR